MSDCQVNTVVLGGVITSNLRCVIVPCLLDCCCLGLLAFLPFWLPSSLTLLPLRASKFTGVLHMTCNSSHVSVQEGQYCCFSLYMTSVQLRYLISITGYAEPLHSLVTSFKRKWSKTCDDLPLASVLLRVWCVQVRGEAQALRSEMETQRNRATQLEQLFQQQVSLEFSFDVLIAAQIIIMSLPPLHGE